MASVKISALPALVSTALTDIYPTVQGGVTYKVTLAQLLETTSNQSLVRLATTTALTATYANGTAGVGATLTNAGAMAALSLDGVAVAANDIVMIKDQASTFQNGIYTVTTIGSGAANWVLTRANYYDEPGEIDIGDFFTIQEGTTNAKTQWLETATVATIGTDAITFQSNVVAGTGIVKTNNTISVSGGGLNVVVVTAASANMAVNTRYISNSAGLVSLLLPATCSVGDTLEIVGLGAGGWSITQNAGDIVHIGSTASTTGVGGSVSSANRYDSVRLGCIVADNEWSSIGGPQSAGLVIV